MSLAGLSSLDSVRVGGDAGENHMNNGRRAPTRSRNRVASKSRNVSNLPQRQRRDSYNLQNKNSCDVGSKFRLGDDRKDSLVMGQRARSDRPGFSASQGVKDTIASQTRSNPWSTSTPMSLAATGPKRSQLKGISSIQPSSYLRNNRTRQDESQPPQDRASGQSEQVDDHTPHFPGPESAQPTGSWLRYYQKETLMDLDSSVSRPRSTDDGRTANGGQDVEANELRPLPSMDTTVQTSTTPMEDHNFYISLPMSELEACFRRDDQTLRAHEAALNARKHKLQPPVGTSVDSPSFRRVTIRQDMENEYTAFQTIKSAHVAFRHAFVQLKVAMDGSEGAKNRHMKRKASQTCSPPANPHVADSPRLTNSVTRLMSTRAGAGPMSTPSVQGSHTAMDTKTTDIRATVPLNSRASTPEELLGIQAEITNDLQSTELTDLLEAVSQLHSMEQELETLRMDRSLAESRQWRTKTRNNRRRYRRPRQVDHDQVSDAQLLKSFGAAETELLQQIANQRRVVEQARSLCLSRGVVREDRIEMYSIGLRIEDERLADLSDNGSITGAEKSEWTRPYSRFTLLVSFPRHRLTEPLLTSGRGLRQAMDLPLDDPKREHQIATITREYTIENLLQQYGRNENKLDFIGRWLLQKLRVSAHEAEILVSTFSLHFTVTNLELWQQQVLYFWNKDQSVNLPPRRLYRFLP